MRNHSNEKPSHNGRATRDRSNQRNPLAVKKPQHSQIHQAGPQSRWGGAPGPRRRRDAMPGAEGLPVPALTVRRLRDQQSACNTQAAWRGPERNSNHTFPPTSAVGAQQAPGEQWPACNSSSPWSGGHALRGQRDSRYTEILREGSTQPQPRVQHFPAGGRGWISEVQGNGSRQSGPAPWSREVSSSLCPVSPGNLMAVGGLPGPHQGRVLATKPSGGHSQRELPEKRTRPCTGLPSGPGRSRKRKKRRKKWAGGCGSFLVA